ncbi:hypothetical protein AMJ49_01625 [Parcubacteria bacterium DG_74_2]|nr:MAG: hypothetical protein AMJ49_01625 [Parcubacteria bacterium DG_74_2]
MILGHKKQWDFLIRMVNNKKIPHALLFSGQERLGKKKVAIEFSRFLLGGEPFSHSDFIFVEPKGNLISISQIRDLIWRLSLKSFSAPFKIALLDKVHLMPADSQNCFLKTLEEPKNSLLILITEHPELLFSTITSRCQTIKFLPVKTEEIKNFLAEKGIEDKKAEKIAKISEGKPGEAIKILNFGKFEENEKQIEDLKKILNSPLHFKFKYAKNLIDEEKLSEVLKNWTFYLRRVFIRKVREKDPFLKKLKDNILLLEKINFLISTKNINKKLALEILMLEL